MNVIGMNLRGLILVFDENESYTEFNIIEPLLKYFDKTHCDLIEIYPTRPFHAVEFFGQIHEELMKVTDSPENRGKYSEYRLNLSHDDHYPTLEDWAILIDGQVSDKFDVMFFTKDFNRTVASLTDNTYRRLFIRSEIYVNGEVLLKAPERKKVS